MVQATADRRCDQGGSTSLRLVARVRPPHRPARLPAAVYRRRRLLAAGLLLIALAVGLVMARLAQAGIGGGPLATTGAAASYRPAPAGARFYVVEPGDTLWSIARQLDPNGDERPLVDVLDREVGGATVYPGERIEIPVHW
jgi:hypothetical protein